MATQCPVRAPTAASVVIIPRRSSPDPVSVFASPRHRHRHRSSTGGEKKTPAGCKSPAQPWMGSWRCSITPSGRCKTLLLFSRFDDRARRSFLFPMRADLGRDPRCAESERSISRCSRCQRSSRRFDWSCFFRLRNLDLARNEGPRCICVVYQPREIFVLYPTGSWRDQRRAVGASRFRHGGHRTGHQEYVSAKRSNSNSPQLISLNWGYWVSFFCTFWSSRPSAFSGECQIIMKVLRQRLGNTDANWRHLYKVMSSNWNWELWWTPLLSVLGYSLMTGCLFHLQALAVAEYLLANGTERAVEEIIDNSPQIAVCAVLVGSF